MLRKRGALRHPRTTDLSFAFLFRLADESPIRTRLQGIGNVSRLGSSRHRSPIRDTNLSFPRVNSLRGQLASPAFNFLPLRAPRHRRDPFSQQLSSLVSRYRDKRQPKGKPSVSVLERCQRHRDPSASS